MGRASRRKAARRGAAGEPAGPPAGAARPSGSGAWKLGVAGAGALLVAGLVALLALSSSTGSGGSGAGGSAAPGSGDRGDVGSFTVADIDGSRVHRPGGRPGVLFFMAGWCGSCIPEAEALAALKDEHGEAIEVLAISIDPSDSVEGIRSFIEVAGASSYPFHWDREGRLTRRYDVRALDTSLVYDPRGRIVFRDAAPTGREALEAALRKAGLS